MQSWVTTTSSVLINNTYCNKAAEAVVYNACIVVSSLGIICSTNIRPSQVLLAINLLSVCMCEQKFALETAQVQW